MSVSPRSLEVLAFIRQRTATRGFPPTLREIGQGMGIASTNGVRWHLGVLEEAGLIIRDRRVSRGIRVLAAALLCVLALSSRPCEARPKIELATSFGSMELMARPAPNARLLDFLGGEQQAFWLILDTQAERTWFTFAARCDSVLSWRAGDGLVLELRDGRQVRSSCLMTCTPPTRCGIVFLGLVDRRVPRELLMDRELPDGTPTVPIFASFPDPRLDLGDVLGVRVQAADSGAAAPAPKNGGAK